MNKRLALTLIAMAFVAAGCNPESNSPATSSSNTMTLGNTVVKIEVADNYATRQKGLSDRSSLASDSGMLFVFDKPEKYSFWMKDTNFPLDFIWIRENKIVEITPDVPTQLNVTDDKLKVYEPKVPVDSMLEVNAGFAAKNGLKVGDRADLTK